MKVLYALLLLILHSSTAGAQETPTWRYYRPSNTGIQGDYCEAIWLDPDGHPYIGGYSPGFEEGGFAVYLEEENRWINYHREFSGGRSIRLEIRWPRLR